MLLDHLGITIDTSRDESLSEFSLALLKDYYCRAANRVNEEGES